MLYEYEIDNIKIRVENVAYGYLDLRNGRKLMAFCSPARCPRMCSGSRAIEDQFLLTSNVDPVAL